MASIPILVVTRAGDELPDPADSGQALVILDNDGNVVLEVYNPGADASITFKTTYSIAGQLLSDTIEVVPSGSRVWFGPFPPAIYNDGSQSVAVESDAGMQVRGLRF